MKHLLIIIVLISAIFLYAGNLFAAGAWEENFNDPGLFSWSYNTDVAWITAQKIISVGYFQEGLTAVQTVWRSWDGGSTFAATRRRQGINPCSLINGLAVIYGVDYFSNTNGAFGGGSTPSLCTIAIPVFPECLLCLLEYDPTIWHSSDDGTTLTERKRALFHWYQAYLRIQALNDTEAWAVGFGPTVSYSYWDPDLQIIRWLDPTYLPETGQDADYLDLHFFDPDTGYIIMAWDMNDDKRRLVDENSEPVEVLNAFLEEQAHREWRINPKIRLMSKRFGAKQKSAAYSKIYYTSSHGSGWGTRWIMNNVTILRISFSSEKRGIMATDEISVAGGAQFKLYYTNSNGYNWFEADIPDYGPNVGGPYEIGDIVMVTSAYGFAAGAEDDGSSDMKGFLLYTVDGGQTWSPTYLQPSYPINSFDFKDRTLGFAVGENRVTLRFQGSNSPPVADAGQDQEVKVNTTVDLDATGSSDNDDLDIEFNWSQVSGPIVNIQHDTFPLATFKPSKTGDYLMQVVVSDGIDSDSDQVTITVTDDDDDTTDDDSVDDDSTDDDSVDDDSTDDDVSDDDSSDDDSNDDDSNDDDSGDDDSGSDPNWDEDEGDPDWGGIENDPPKGGCCG